MNRAPHLVSSRTSDEVSEVRLADPLGLDPADGEVKVAQEDGRGHVVQAPGIRGKGAIRRRLKKEKEKRI